MVKSCAAWGCTHREVTKRNQVGSDRGKDLTFHRFPLKNELLLKQWLVALRREKFEPTKHSRICSMHFLPQDYDDTGYRRRLRSGVVPSVFSFPAHLIKIKNPVRKSSAWSNIRDNKQSTAERQLLHDHSYYSTKNEVQQNPVEIMKKSLEEKERRLRRKVKTLHQKNRRAHNRVRRLKDCLQNLKSQNLIEATAHEMLENAFGGMSLDLFKHLMRRSKENENRVPSYNKQIKAFAVTLNYLSPKAYEYVRHTLCLPHPTTLRTWRRSISAEPGFLTQALEAAAKNSESSNLCSLVLDEMSLRKEVVWCQDQHAFSGHVDFGGGPIDDTVASNALVFMLVSLKSAWKTPIAYFLTNNLNSETLSRNILDAIMKAADRGLLVKTVVADGLKVNLKAGTHLGCKLTAIDPICHFLHPHPSFKDEKVWYICDPPHMLKLVRNILGDTGRVYVQRGDVIKPIQWSFIVSLHKLQSTESVYLANKLTAKHIHYRNVKMKVHLAAQTLSSSVATAIDHLRDDLQIPDFQGSEETSHFLRIVDQLFDRLNTKNPFANGFKAPLSNRNRQEWVTFFNDAVQYLLSLLDCQGKTLHSSSRGTAVVGFIISATSASGLAQELIDRHQFQYVLSYKFCQDHLEMFFGKIRQRGGWNNNPTADEFRKSLKALLLKNEVKAPSQGNTLQQDDTESEDISLDVRHVKPDHARPVWDDELIHASEMLETGLQLPDEDWRMSCLVYTAGFVCRRLGKTIKCGRCRMAVESAAHKEGEAWRFFNRKNRGGLIAASHGIIEILKSSEKAFRLLMPSPDEMDSLPKEKFIDLKMKMLVVNSLLNKMDALFPSLQDHFWQHEIGNEEPHSLQLLQLVVTFYIKMKLLKAGKLHHQRILLKGAAPKRIKLNKFILFMGQ